MAVQSVRVAKITALANGALLLLFIAFLAVLAWLGSVTEDPDFDWVLRPVVAISFLLGGTIWIVGLVASIRAWKKGETGATRFLLFNQSYLLFWGLTIAWFIVRGTSSA